MMHESNSPNQDIPKTRSKRQLLIAISLGLLTFVITPLVTIAIVLPFLLLGKVSEAFNPIIIISKISGLQGLGGFFAAQFILIGFFALAGNFATAIISWLINHSKKLAAVTFLSALTLQFVALAIILPMTIRQSQRTMVAGIEHEKAIQQFAEIGNISYEVQEPYSDREISNLHPEYGPIYKKLKIVVPISVSRAGTYLVTAQYSFSKDGVWGNTPMKNITRTFDAKDHAVKIEFLANEAGGSYGYWSPGSVGGKAEVQISYLASKKEAVENLKPDSSIDKSILKRFMEDEGLNKEIKPNQIINKFVERKGIRFDLYNTGVSDGEYIEIAKQTIEVQEFLDKYPKAKAYVDRSGSLAVDFRLDKYQKNEILLKYLRLRIFIDPQNNRPTKRFIDCSGTVIKNDLLEYLQKERCFE